MESETILNGLESLKNAGLFRTPKKFGGIASFWLQRFGNMPDAQFLCSIDAIIDNEGTWPSIAIINKYSFTWTGSEKNREKNICPYCENTGFLLIKSKGKDIAYACQCEIGQKALRNLKIVSYESLGIPWPEIEKPDFSKKMSKKNKQLLDDYLGRIGEKMPEGSEEKLWEIMTDGSLCES